MAYTSGINESYQQRFLSAEVQASPTPDVPQEVLNVVQVGLPQEFLELMASRARELAIARLVAQASQYCLARPHTITPEVAKRLVWEIGVIEMFASVGKMIFMGISNYLNIVDGPDYSIYYPYPATSKEINIPQEVLDAINRMVQVSADAIRDYNRCEAVRRLVEDVYGSTTMDCSRILTE